MDSENLEEAAAALGEDQEAWWQDFIASKEQLLTVLQVSVETQPAVQSEGQLLNSTALKPQLLTV